MLASYRTLVQTLWKKFHTIRCVHSPRAKNMYADALATLAAKIHISEEKQNIAMSVVRRNLPCPFSELLQPPDYNDDENWRAHIINKLLEPTSANISNLKHFILIHRVLYHRDVGGVLARCVSKNEAKERLEVAHE